MMNLHFSPQRAEVACKPRGAETWRTIGNRMIPAMTVEVVNV